MIEPSIEIKNLCQQLLDLYKARVNEEHRSSGELSDTATYTIENDGKYFTVCFNLAEYWKYLENGTKPHFPPPSAIEQWITVKPLIPKAINGKIPTTKQLAFLISRKISEVGTPATKMLERTINSPEADSIIEQIEDEIIKIIEIQIDEEDI